MRSKSLEDLKAELIQVAANGYREVVLVGINLSAYGLDEDFDLADAVECACSVDGIDRVRLGSIEPERMDKNDCPSCRTAKVLSAVSSFTAERLR